MITYVYIYIYIYIYIYYNTLQKTCLSCRKFSEKIKYFLTVHYFVVIMPTVLYCAYIAIALAVEYKKNDEKQENLDNTQSRKTKKDLDKRT